MKIIQNGTEGQRYAVHARVERGQSPHAPGLTLIVSTTYEDTRKPQEHRTVYQQYFPSQADYDRFVGFLEQFSFVGVRHKESPLQIK